MAPRTTSAARATFKGSPVDTAIDVRTKLEYWMGHLEGAMHIPVDTIGEELPQRADIGVDSHILVYCASGARSAAAAAQLRALGYRRVIDGGGIGSASQHYVAP